MPKKAEEKNKGGRPLKFKTVKELQEKIEAYFESCFEPIMDLKLREDYKGKKNEATADDHEWVQRLNWNNEPLYKQIKPFTVTGLALYLDTTRDLLLDYEEKDKFSDTIKRAKLKIHEYAEEYLFTGKNQTAAIFNLKNNWGWKDKTETDVNNPDGNLKTLIIQKAKTKKDEDN